MRYTLVKMEIVPVEEKENLFFNRIDLKLRIKHLGTSTPSKADIIKELATKYEVSEEQVQIDYIFSKKGLGESFVSAKILKEKPLKEGKGEASETQASAAT